MINCNSTTYETVLELLKRPNLPEDIRNILEATPEQQYDFYKKYRYRKKPRQHLVEFILLTAASRDGKKEGNHYTQFILSQCFLKGDPKIGLEHDFGEYLKLLRAAGCDDVKSETKPLNEYKDANPTALFILSKMYRSGGNGFPKDEEKALILLRAAAGDFEDGQLYHPNLRRGNGAAQYLLAKIYMKGKGVLENLPISRRLMRSSARNGNPKAIKIVQERFNELQHQANSEEGISRRVAIEFNKLTEMFSEGHTLIPGKRTWQPQTKGPSINNGTTGITRSLEQASI